MKLHLVEYNTNNIIDIFPRSDHSPSIQIERNHEGVYAMFFRRLDSCELHDGWTYADIRALNEAIATAQSRIDILNGKTEE